MRNNLLIAAVLLFTACTPKHFEKSKSSEKKDKPTPVSMSPVSYLRKISLHIRGQTPERAEYAELSKAVQADRTADFFKDKIAEYLKSDAHIDKMSFRIEELFHLRPTPVPFTSALLDYYGSGLYFPIVDSYTARNSMNELVRRIAGKNMSWDTLLTGKEYRAFPMSLSMSLTGLNTGDFLFYSTAANVQANAEAEADIRFLSDDPRVAGVLTTGRFFARNVNTNLNKNRKRAAAVFRVFLCDDMKAVVVDESGNQNEILDRVFPGSGGTAPGSDVHVNATTGDIHGSDPACMKCHYKLDPMGMTFQDSGMILHKLASPGALVYTRASGAKVNIPVAGVGALGKAITEQPEYVNCQTSHFWRWFVGEDIPLTPSIQAELSTKFEEVGRKTNDFIAYLMTRPEFGYVQSGESNAQLIAQVKGVLKNCTGCHALENIPSFTQWPIGGNDLTHQKWITGIRTTMALDGSSAKRTMPPKESAWQPSRTDLETLQRWLDLGAPNE